MVHRKLNRTAKHRACLLRNLVSNLLEHESIVTTHAKAKEAQTAAERLITKAKKASVPLVPETREQFKHQIYKPDMLIPKLFDQLRDRYMSFNGGYTRVLRLEPRLGDNAPQSILELIGGKRDMRRAMTARVVARFEQLGVPLDGTTEKNVLKICRDKEATESFRAEVDFMKQEFYNDPSKIVPVPLFPATKKAPTEIRPNPLEG